jgi:hypothetical protein
MAQYELDDFQANMVRRLVRDEIKRVKGLPTSEHVDGLRLSEKAVWITDLNYVEAELGKKLGGDV